MVHYLTQNEGEGRFKVTHYLTTIPLVFNDWATSCSNRSSGTVGENRKGKRKKERKKGGEEKKKKKRREMIEYSPYGMVTNAICHAVIHVHVCSLTWAFPTHVYNNAEHARIHTGCSSPLLMSVNRAVASNRLYTLNVKRRLVGGAICAKSPREIV